MTMKALVFATAFGSVLTLCAAEAPAPTAATTNAAPVVTQQQTKTQHSGCRPKRPGKHGGGVEMKHNCCKKTSGDSSKK